MHTLPGDILIVIVNDVDVDSLSSLASVNKLLCKLITNNDIIRKLAKIHNLPYSATFGQLIRYRELPTMNLLAEAASMGDIRVVTDIVDSGACTLGDSLSRIHVHIQAAISKAARNGHQDIVDRLIEVVGNISSKSMTIVTDDYGDTLITNGCDNALIAAARGGHLELYNHIVDNWADELEDCHYIQALEGAAKGGHVMLINEILSVGVWIDNYDMACANAARYGYEDIVDQMILLGANDYRLIAVKAAEGGHIAIVDKMLTLRSNSLKLNPGPINILVNHMNTIKNIIISASRYGHIAIVIKFTRLYNMRDKDYSEILCEAAKGGHIDIINWIAQSVNDNNIYGNAISDAVRYGHLKVVERLLDLFCKCECRMTCFNCHSTLGFSIIEAAAGGNLDILNLFISDNYDASDNYDVSDNYERAIVEAANHGHRHIVNRLLECCTYNRNSILLSAAKGGHRRIVRQMIKLGANNFKEAMTAAYGDGHVDIVNVITVIVNINM